MDARGFRASHGNASAAGNVRPRISQGYQEGVFLFSTYDIFLHE